MLLPGTRQLAPLAFTEDSRQWRGRPWSEWAARPTHKTPAGRGKFAVFEPLPADWRVKKGEGQGPRRPASRRLGLIKTHTSELEAHPVGRP